MSRRDSTYTVDAQQVQGNPGATVTFRGITIGERREYLDHEDVNDITMLRSHIVAWSGIVDDDGNELPNPTDEPGVIDALYLDEMRALTRLLWAGPNGESPKN